jgi:hypothetical protein
MGICYFCKTELEAPIYRSSECPQCGKETKTCYNCDFYSETSHWECRESINEQVLEKDRSNFCDYFRLSTTDDPGRERKNNPVDDLKKLFGD